VVRLGVHVCVWSTGADVSAEDIGNYTCEVHGPHNALLASVTHSVHVAGANPPLFAFCLICTIEVGTELSLACIMFTQI